ncbi:hypothetical protein RhiirB3_456261 [Rhizophagus irregularis]|nr:hypothetical protein RhiirB3_456261 [Rhizophagus irregularis]
MITYWKSNVRKEFGFFGQEINNKPKLSDSELNRRITEALAEADNTDDNVVVLIEKVWIEDEIDLSNNLILKDIGNIPKDLDEEFIDNEENNNENISLTDDETVNNGNGKGILNYNVDDLLDEYINEHL